MHRVNDEEVMEQHATVVVVVSLAPASQYYQRIASDMSTIAASPVCTAATSSDGNLQAGSAFTTNSTHDMCT